MRILHGMLCLTAGCFLWAAEAVAEIEVAPISQLLSDGQDRNTSAALAAAPALLPREMHRRRFAEERYLITVRRLGRGAVHHRSGYPRMGQHRYHRHLGAHSHYRRSADQYYYLPRQQRPYYGRAIGYPDGGHRYVLPYFAQPTYVQPSPYYPSARIYREDYGSPSIYRGYRGHPRISRPAYGGPLPRVIYGTPRWDQRSGPGYRFNPSYGHRYGPQGYARPQVHRIPGAHRGGLNHSGHLDGRGPQNHRWR